MQGLLDTRGRYAPRVHGLAAYGHQLGTWGFTVGVHPKRRHVWVMSVRDAGT